MTEKKQVLLLGDGFFARGFLHNINRNLYDITQIYKDPFINPQDIMWNLQRGLKYKPSFHIKDKLYTKSNILSIKETITAISFKSLGVEITTVAPDLTAAAPKTLMFNPDYLIIGLGNFKTIKDWTEELSTLPTGPIDIIGLGPTGVELGSILSSTHSVYMYDMLPYEKVMPYVSPQTKEKLLLNFPTNITYGQMYTGKRGIFTGNTRQNNITAQLKVDEYLMYTDNKSKYTTCYIGGDGANTPVPFNRSGQVAYQQGAYVAKRLNGEIPLDVPFNYDHNGIALNLKDKKVLIEGHKIVPDGIYPDFIIRLYSLFFV